MTHAFTPHESQALLQLINLGLQHAAASFSMLTQQQITICSDDLQLSQDFGSAPEAAHEPRIVLLTQIRGALRGTCLLLLTEAAAEHLLKMCLPAAAGQDAAERQTMREAFLLEADNIVTAAVVTQFAEWLEVPLYGDVPKLLHLTPVEIARLMDAGSSGQAPLSFRTRFRTQDAAFESAFVWSMDTAFADRVRQLARDEAFVTRLEQAN